MHRAKASIRAETFPHTLSIHFLCLLQEKLVFIDPQNIVVDEKD